MSRSERAGRAAVPHAGEDDVHGAVDERPLLGRDPELRELAGVLADVASNRGRVRLRTIAVDAGWTGVGILSIDHPFWRFYRLVG